MSGRAARKAKAYKLAHPDWRFRRAVRRLQVRIARCFKKAYAATPPLFSAFVKTERTVAFPLDG